MTLLHQVRVYDGRAKAWGRSRKLRVPILNHKQEAERFEQCVPQRSREEGVLKRNRELFQTLAPRVKIIAVGKQGMISDSILHQ